MYQTLLIIYLQTVSAMLYTFNKTIIIVVFTPQPTSPGNEFFERHHPPCTCLFIYSDRW